MSLPVSKSDTTSLLNDGGKGGGRVARFEWNVGAACFENGEDRDDGVDRGFEVDAWQRRWDQSHAGSENARKPIGPLIQIGIGDRLIAIEERHTIRLRGNAELEQFVRGGNIFRAHDGRVRFTE